MEIGKVLGVSILGVCLILLLKQYKPEYTIAISLLVGCIIFSYVLQKLSLMIDLLRELAMKINLDSHFLSILLKITGIAYLTEFSSNMCKDAGETAIASKVEFAGRVFICAISIPILSTLLEMMLSVIS